ncbi:hydroxyquinol 1,2-dioxygenase [Bradyrhizobium sp. KBS0727]|uniref:dioxygenase family protein n=1 Tax=unclassified Bradyrhizobium TaxID=2631580 RepID=UPI00110DD029|nr:MULTISPECIES: dioxygenase [unclassified Bradyrhizobium]QDW36537.1 hydroxyquinol 1,2-dioxygenase [Bradyrhizobium sp. KBS0725]QDW43137.1 hydroxyquinol 1,2-dioxygenase [Bradyrhizobium sp. KBS0727]
MRELTPETITDAVLDQMATTPDPRLKAIMASAVKHLHAFARDVNLTPGEWIKGIEFMTLAGKMCSPERQEFILLSDTLGLSALVNGLHDKTAIEEGTHTSLLGPFYREATPTLKAGSSIAQNPKPGSECVLYGRVTDAGGKPVANATVSIWQTGADGLYDIQSSATSVDYRGVFTSDAEGIYVLRTVKPLGYSIPMDGPVGAMVKAQARHGMRPAHIHFLVGAPGYRELVTALYLRDDPHLADDVVFGSSGDLAVDVVPGDPDCPIKGMPSIRFDMRLSRESEADKTGGRVGADPAAIMKQSKLAHAGAGD